MEEVKQLIFFNMVEKYIEKLPSGKYRVRMSVNGVTKNSSVMNTRKEARELKAKWIARYKKV